MIGGLICTCSAVSMAAGSTQYSPVTTGGFVSTSTVEADNQITWRSAGTFSNMTLFVTSNSTSSNSTVQFRKNTANGNQLLTIGSGATGVFTETTHTDTIVAGDILDYQTIAGATSTFAWSSLQITFMPTDTSTIVNKLASCSTLSDASVSTNFFAAPMGLLSTGASANTEANAQFVNRAPATWKNLYVLCNSNGRTSTTTINTRKNTANGNLTIGIGSGATGVFEDTTNSDTLVSGDLINYEITTGIGVGTIVIKAIATDYITSNYQSVYGSAIAGGSTAQLTSVTTFFGFCASLSTGGAENARQAILNQPYAFTNLQCGVQTNSITATSTVSLRFTGVTGKMAVSIGSSATGLFEDTTNGDTGQTSAKICYQLVTGATGTSIVLNWVGVRSQVLGNPWFPAYAAEVVPAPKAAQFSDVRQKTLPSPIAQNNFYPAQVEAQVKANPPNAQFTYFAQVLPKPITINKFYPTYDPTVRPWPRRECNYFAELLPTPVAINNFYPAYEAQVVPWLRAAQFTYFAQLLPTPIAILPWFPAYEAQVKPWLKNDRQTAVLALPYLVDNWFPVYDAQVKARPPRAFYSIVASIIKSFRTFAGIDEVGGAAMFADITGGSNVFTDMTGGTDIFTDQPLPLPNVPTIN